MFALSSILQRIVLSLMSISTMLAAAGTANLASTTTAFATSTPPQATTTIPYLQTHFGPEWEVLWGSATTTDGTLALAATASTTGAEVYLPLASSSNWQDYTYTVNANVSNGDLTLIGRYIDSKNYFSCSFSGRWVGLNEEVNGTEQSLGEMTVSSAPSHNAVNNNENMSMTVNGNQASCANLLTPAVTNTIDPSLSHGTIGIETWNSAPGIARLDLRSVDVEAPAQP